MDAFEYNGNPARVIFGSGTINRLPEELSRLNLTKPLILSTPQQVSQAEDVKKVLKGQVVGLFSNATMHTPTEVTEEACKLATSTQADAVVSIGGGSTIGLGKAISIRSGLYHIAIPTTYAGSEVTPILGETANGRKETRSDPAILPGTVIYDVDLTLTLPVSLTSTSGVNAIAHAVEALYARSGNPIISLLAQEGVRALASALPDLIADPTSKDARSKALYGAWLCGTCLGSVGMSLHHKLCHTLGGSFNLPHAETHTIVLPHALAFNAPKIPQAMKMLADALPEGNGDAVRGLNVLLSKLKVERALKGLGMKEGDIDKAADIAVSKPYWNPRPFERNEIREVIRRAWAGEEARVDNMATTATTTSSSEDKKTLHLVGLGVQHSIAPPMHNHITSSLHLPWTFHATECATIDSLLSLARAPTTAGLVVTMPYKNTIIPHLDALDPLAVQIGAVNNVYRDPTDPSLLRGTNTDWLGIKGCLLEKSSSAQGEPVVVNKPALIVGAGGASRAAVYALSAHFHASSIYVLNRDDAEVADLIRDAQRLSTSPPQPAGPQHHARQNPRPARAPRHAALHRRHSARLRAPIPCRESRAGVSRGVPSERGKGRRAGYVLQAKAHEND
ncbi:hypothetical protein N0V83_004356 [Neocucurbitaria cava]|uniref:Alcohol dehydrogenase iron-type/glycerol dehydrogenase GldA domain-containing protein n=1 Tax=Neocucurbitaria cava TaxID=798079 RepID=A0A9W8YBS7_9PLEO|nr:hypothetical protein N0V83_004356 [Neocucurbitaria cava]